MIEQLARAIVISHHACKDFDMYRRRRRYGTACRMAFPAATAISKI
jgi:hypothetical protein